MINHFPRRLPLPPTGRSSAILVFACVLANSLAFAETVPVVADRQNDMKEIAAAAKTISDMFKAPETYSSTKFKEASEAISDRADRRLTDHFATVTAAEGSKANEVIATERNRFSELARDLKTYADALSSTADRHPDRMSDDMRMKEREPMGGGPLGTRIRSEASMSAMSAEHAFHLMLQTCASCHSRFRAK
ncbi:MULTISPECIES: cytochrome c [Rhizobium]|uniref:cytochrome c n=1 Tax=Rhizobium TaxID=379 RepID=UPI0007F16B85|nr:MULTISPECIES: cytochrome c [Rhizobium]ANK87024.1 cytochrome-c-like protein [Rhizobium sp. N731]ANK92980.1 cytochrome-c-like protein [Rhizobium sp. N6212]ANK99026.1 cytochrome-c-like protein [Rhizobium sp. N621]ANL05154.1 cytochrome-c-like protein [Rhizobium esperanzae]ANL11211.1 cytochrome-c-like protein [Rhizobium sp. N1341]